MEPAANRREHETIMTPFCFAVPLQWSPPLNGGNTSTGENTFQPKFEANHLGKLQWSPPSTGGNTSAASTLMAERSMLQWSPPLTGGSTRAGQGARNWRQGAAMEPADDRREHEQHVERRQLRRRAAMEPADDRREHRHAGFHGAVEPARAAMEPANDRREREGTSGGPLTIRGPQWSPPTIGGSTSVPD